MGTAEILMVASPLLATAVNVTSHVAIMRARVFGAHLGPVIVAFLIGLAALIGITWRLGSGLGMAPGDLLALELLHVGSYAGFGYCYFTAVNLVLTSLRVRMVCELLESPPDGYPADRLKMVYNLDAILRKRLERLTAWGQIRVSGERYCIAGTPAFLVLDRQILRFRRLITGGAEVRGSQSDQRH